MRLFVVTWNAAPGIASKAFACLRSMVRIYPGLDPASVRSVGGAGPAFAACIQTHGQSAEAIFTRNNTGYLLDGLPVDRLAEFRADSAPELAARWDRLAERLEGQFVIARVSGGPAAIEVLTDPLGLGQLYYFRDGRRWVLSNSVAIIEALTRPTSWDPDGVSLFLGLGWVGGDRTLRSGIRTMPGGARWTWRDPDAEPRLTSYFSMTDVAGAPAIGRKGLDRCIADLTRLCSALALVPARTVSGLTGGRDSRAVTALLVQAGIDASYTTRRDAGSADADVAARIAAKLGLRHRITPTTDGRMMDEWDGASARLVLQNDGMVSLWQVADFVSWSPSTSERRVMIAGLGGEVARAHWSPLPFLLSRGARSELEGLLLGLVREPDSLLCGAVRERAAEHLHAFAATALDSGLAPVDVPDAFYAWGRLRRWGGINLRKSGEVFAPLCARDFVHAAFALPALRRYAEALHYAIVRAAPASIWALPFAGEPWRPQRPELILLRSWLERQAHEAVQHVPWRLRKRLGWIDREPPLRPPSNQVQWLEARREELRNLCMDQRACGLWDVVNREAFDQVMASTTAPAQRRRLAPLLYDVFTLFYYEAHRQRLDTSGNTSALPGPPLR